jgi:hypothetical protein
MSNEIEVVGPVFYGTSGRPIATLRLLSGQPRRRQRKPSLASALRQANKVGAAVCGAEIKPDGSVALSFGTAAGPTVANEWDGVTQ